MTILIIVSVLILLFVGLPILIGKVIKRGNRNPF